MKKTLDEINLIAAKAVASAHKKGNTPSSMIIMDKLNEKKSRKFMLFLYDECCDWGVFTRSRSI